MAYKIFDNMWTIINNPNGIKDRFATALQAYGVNYTIPKTVSVYVDPYNIAVTGMTVAPIVNNASYPENEHFLIMGIRGFQGTAAAPAQTAWTAGITDALAQNGSFILNNSGTIEVKNMPLTVFQPGSNYPDSGLLLLEKPVFWKAQTQLLIQLSFPTVPATANLNIRFELMGIKLI